MTVCLPQNRCPSFGRATSPWLEELVDEIIAPGEDHLLDQDLGHWRQDLQERLKQIRRHPEQTRGGFIEEHIRQATLRLQRSVVQQAMQDEADAVDEICPDCHRPLRDKKRRVPRWIDAYCGKVRLVRTHGWCPHCGCWHFPADRVLGLRADSTASPLVQEMCALLVSKMPAEQAEALSLRITGRRLSRSTLAREAQRQGDTAVGMRQRLVETPVWVAPAAGAKAAAALKSPVEPFTLVLQMDAWNIRERDHWGQTQKRRRKNLEVERWHWVYTGTCFRLSHCCKKGRFRNKLRAVITERSYVATRGGIDALVEQLYYEARARGLAHAQRVLVIADGAVWIWNLVEDRFKDAVQRLDLWHATSYLWAVANALHGNGSKEARQWVKPLLTQIRNDQAANVITQLEELKPHLVESAAKVTQDTIDYYKKNQKRMKYKEGRNRKEPVGSGAIESTCRQLQCRMKRCGQFWSTRGDEALLCLDMFWRNERWEMLFPHAQLTAVANN